MINLLNRGFLSRSATAEPVRIPSTAVKPGMILMGSEGVVLSREAYPALVTSVEPRPNGVKIFLEDNRGEVAIMGLLSEDNVHIQRKLRG